MGLLNRGGTFTPRQPPAVDWGKHLQEADAARAEEARVQETAIAAMHAAEGPISMEDGLIRRAAEMEARQERFEREVGARLGRIETQLAGVINALSNRNGATS